MFLQVHKYYLKVLEKCGLDEASPLTYHAGFWLSYTKENLNWRQNGLPKSLKRGDIT